MMYKDNSRKIILDECFQFGIGAFETIAVEKAIPIFLKEHLKRLDGAAEYLSVGSIKEHGISEQSVLDYLENQQTDLEHCALKIMISSENTVFSMRQNPYKPQQYDKGIVMDFSTVRRNETSPLVGYKTMNYADCILEKRKAAAQGIDERIFLNTKGQVAEGTVSNIFFVRDGKLYTPDKSCGLLAGIMRDYICRTEKVNEFTVYPEEIKEFDECFVTNSLMGIMPVKRLGDDIFTKREVTDRLIKKYNDIIYKYMEIRNEL